MMRQLFLVLLASGLLLTTWAPAQEPPLDQDEPPLRLKKKAKPDTDKPEQPKPPKVEAKKPEDSKEPEPAQPQENDKEVLDRISRNMRSLEERLANKELGDGTQQVGDDILKDIDALIRLSENPPPQGGNGGEDSQPSGSSNDQKNSTGKSGSSGQPNPSPNGGSSKRRDRTKSGSGPQTATGPKSAGKPDKDPAAEQTTGAGKNGAGGNDKSGEPNRNADLYKDIWGHLPEALRAEMNAYSTDKEMIPKYDALIKKCSRAIAEQSSRKTPK